MLAGVYVPDKFLMSLKMTAQIMLEIISRANGITRVPRISFDRSYIAHMRRIIATAAHQSSLFLKVNNLQSAAPRKGTNVH